MMYNIIIIQIIVKRIKKLILCTRVGCISVLFKLIYRYINKAII